MAGGPGSGKSTLLEGIDPAKQSVNANVDDVLPNLFPTEDPDRFYDCYAEAQLVLEELIKQSVAARFNIVIDTTGRNVEAYKRLAKSFQDQGYTTMLMASYVPVEVGRARVRARASVQFRSIK